MASSRFPILRGADAQQSRVQDGIAQLVTPVAKALQNTPIMGAPPPAWIHASLLAGWVNLNATDKRFPPARFHKNALGYAYLQFFITSGTLNTTVMTLPGGMRPNYRLPFVGYAFNGAQTVCFVEIRPDGAVFVNAPAGTTDMALTATFLAEQ